jgi:hypothetical protein
MTISDDSFRESFKPLHVPAHYALNDPEQERVLFALAQIGKGTVSDIANEMTVLEPTGDVENFIIHAANVLIPLFQKGLLKGKEINGDIEYNLSKITDANDGPVDPDLPAQD